MIIGVMASSGSGGSGSTLLSNLVSYWKADESSGTLADQVGGNTGTNSSATLGQAGKIGNAVQFASSSAIISCGHASNLDISFASDLSISFWVKAAVTQAGSYPRLIDKELSYGLYISTGGTISFYNSDIDQEIINHAITDNTWYHIVLTYNHSYLRGYYNNTTGGSDITYSNSLPSNPTVNLTWGNRTALDRYFTGYIDEVGIWSRALSTGEITTLYNGGSGKTYPF